MLFSCPPQVTENTTITIESVLQNVNNDCMFSKSDCDAAKPKALAGCIEAVQGVSSNPGDYFLGLPEGQPLQPRNILLFSRQAPFISNRPDLHHRCLLVFCLQGRGAALVDAQALHMTPGTAVVVTPHQFHHFTQIRGAKLLWLFITFELAEAESLSALRGQLLILTTAQLTLLQQLAARYAHLKGTQRACPEITLLLAALLENLRTHVRRADLQTPEVDGRAPLLFQAVSRYMQEHLSQPIHIPDVARAVGLSASRLRAVFKLQAGVSLGTYMRRLRLHQARVQVLATEQSLKQIAERSGFDSIYSFSRAFRQAWGLSPSAYRKRHLQAVPGAKRPATASAALRRSVSRR